jgi:hypothetical protein
MRPREPAGIETRLRGRARGRAWEGRLEACVEASDLYVHIAKY